MSRRLLMNFLLALAWMALTGTFTFSNFLFGFFLGFVIMFFQSRKPASRKYFTRLPKAIAFVFFFLYELIKANLQVAYDVVTPTFYMRPGIVAIPLDAKTDLEITMLANLISLTPGTLSLDVSDDKKVLYVHAMYIKDKETFINNVKSGFERRLLDIMR